MDPITLGGALSLLGSVSAVTGIHAWLKSFEMERLVKQTKLEVLKLSDRVYHAPSIWEVADTSRTTQDRFRDNFALNEMLRPIQRNLGTTVLSTAAISTPIKLKEAFCRDPWKVLIDIQDIGRLRKPSNPDLVPILFADAGGYYVGWQVHEVLPMLFGCRYDKSSRLLLPEIAYSGDARRSARKQPEARETWEEPTLGIKFRFIPPGRFTMGSSVYELGSGNTEKRRDVMITRGFWMAETVVTQRDWQQLRRYNPSKFRHNGENRPVEMVSLSDSIVFANMLSERGEFPLCYELVGERRGFDMTGPTFDSASLRGLEVPGFRLPTEAEWEYAARAGTKGPYWTGQRLTTEQANYNGTEYTSAFPKIVGKNREMTVDVRSFAANPWGLYEVLGNVFEWVWDSVEGYRDGALTDPLGSTGGSPVVRGGSWSVSALECRSASRIIFKPGHRSSNIGFRLVRTA